MTIDNDIRVIQTLSDMSRKYPSTQGLDGFAKVMGLENIDPTSEKFQEAVRKISPNYSLETAIYASKIVRMGDGLTGDYYTSEPELAA